MARLGSRRVGQPGRSRKMMRQCQMRREGNTTQHMCESGRSNSGASLPLCTSGASRYICWQKIRCQDKLSVCVCVSTGMKGSECMMGRKPRAAANCFSFLSELSHLPFALIHCPVQSQFWYTLHSSELHFGTVHLSAVQMIGSGLALSDEDWHWSSSICLPPRLPGWDCWACCCPHCSH